MNRNWSIYDTYIIYICSLFRVAVNNLDYTESNDSECWTGKDKRGNDYGAI
jgi:hypothetical protein